MTRGKLAWLVPVLLAALSWRIHKSALAAVDIGFDDETVYLEGARSLAKDSPLYPVWYALLRPFTSDAVDRYLLGWFLLASVLPLLVYALARRCGAGIPASVIVALVQLLSHSNEAWPYVGAFAAAFVATGAIALTYVPPQRRPLVLALNAAIVSAASFARPELTFPAIALGAGAIAIGLRTWQSERVAIGVAFAAGVAPLVPLPGRDDGSRSFFAFQQHYAYNIALAEHRTEDPWNQWEPVAHAAFPTARSIAGAALENPGAFAAHVGRNILRFIPALWDLVSPVGYLPLVYAVTLTLALGAVLALVRRKNVDPALRSLLPLLAAVALGALAASLLIHPRRHYLQPLLVLSLAILAGATHRGERRTTVAAIAFAAVLFIMPVKCGDAWSIALPQKRSQCANLQERSTLAVLRGLDLPERVVVFEPDYARGIYLGRPWAGFVQHEKNTDIDVFIAEHPVNVIVVNQRMRAHPCFKDDPLFQQFDDGTRPLAGFTRVPVPGTDVVLGVRLKALR